MHCKVLHTLAVQSLSVIHVYEIPVIDPILHASDNARGIEQVFINALAFDQITGWD